MAFLVYKTYFYPVNFQLNNIPLFKKKALQWAADKRIVCFLDSNSFDDRYAKFDTLIAVGVKDEIIGKVGSAFDELTQFRQHNPGWITGFFTYDLKNEIESLQSTNEDHLHFPDLYFFAPQHLIIIKGDTATCTTDDARRVFEEIDATILPEPRPAEPINLQSRFTRPAYIDAVNKIKNHIGRGDIYVSNFCQEFYADDARIDPVSTFNGLNEVSPNPFGSFFKLNDQYVLCASPERFLAKRGSRLISQPIKGTIRRADDEAGDESAKYYLQHQPKELQENVMIVDLVRNDLTHSAKKGTVSTEELFGVYSFKQLHHLISTVVCELSEEVSPIQAIRNTFPMGSMTGAPKIRAMQLMEDYELSKRGLYSGAIGYFSDDDDFDFNVVIRTLLYNATEHYLSFQAGSAITYDADAASEYEECLVKAQAILEVLGQTQSFPPS